MRKAQHVCRISVPTLLLVAQSLEKILLLLSPSIKNGIMSHTRMAHGMYATTTITLKFAQINVCVCLYFVCSAKTFQRYVIDILKVLLFSFTSSRRDVFIVVVWA